MLTIRDQVLRPQASNGRVTAKPIVFAFAVLLFFWTAATATASTESTDPEKQPSTAFGWISLVLSAAVGGAIGVGYRALSGSYFTNLSVTLTPHRHGAAADSDGPEVTVVDVELEKGGNDALILSAVEFRATAISDDGKALSGRAVQYRKIDVKRMMTSSGDAGGWTVDPEHSAFALAPGDRTQFAVIFAAERGLNYLVELLIVGPAGFRPKSRSQWRAAAIVVARGLAS